ncbi:hypothetical protein NQZ68_015580 [Dissostichus eleginoides]|nr:hypothetical protein NQZ68_015580 [Dissostichus eleginoides]
MENLANKLLAENTSLLGDSKEPSSNTFRDSARVPDEAVGRWGVSFAMFALHRQTGRMHLAWHGAAVGPWGGGAVCLSGSSTAAT